MSKGFKQFIMAILMGSIVLTSVGCGNNSDPANPTIPNEQEVNITALSERNNVFSALSGKDSLERIIKPASQGNGKQVGLFYSLWLGNYYNLKNQPYFKNYHNVSQLLKTEEGRAELFEYKSLTNDTIEMYFSGEPLFGYYNNRDRWVVEKHVQMFIAAGVDFLLIDVSNNNGAQAGNEYGLSNDGRNFYKEPLTVLLEVLTEYNQMGYNAPKVTFLTNTNDVERVTELYNFMYKDNKYQSTWYCDVDNGQNPQGKPWMTINNKSDLSPEVANKFYFKATQWPNGVHNDNGLPWIDFDYPQKNYNGIMNVSVAQHPWGHMSDSVQFKISPNDIDYYNANRGRGYDFYRGENRTAGLASGTNFEQQWATAIDNEHVDKVIITQWNEWAAFKLGAAVNGLTGKYAVWFDCFDFEFSRDIEPRNDEYGDNYYMQMVRNIRKFKGMDGEGIQVDNKTMQKNSISEEWNKVKSGVSDFSGLGVRNYTNALEKGENYVNESKRNEIIEVRVSSDAVNLYVLVTAKNNITTPVKGDTTWMNLWLEVDDQAGMPDGKGYDYVINRTYQNGLGSVEGFTGRNPIDFGKTEVVVNGKYIQYTLDKASFGIENDKPFKIKITDNVELVRGNVLDLYSQGDSAPYGRLNYQFVIKEEA